MKERADVQASALFHIKKTKHEGVNFMNEASGSKKLFSLICLIGGAILLVAALALDFMGTKASYRGTLLVIGIIGVVVGMYILPTLKYHRTLVYIVFLFPLLFAFVVTVIIPLFLGLFYSFTNWNGIRYTEFVGFANYARMFKQTSFLWSILLTTLFVVFNMILVNLVAFLLALLCTSKLRGMGFFRASYFLPNLIGGIVLGYIWQFIFSNVVTQIFKGMKYSMLAETKTAFIAIIIKCQSPGPVFIRQLRTGLGGQDFYCLLFRSLHTNAANNDSQQFPFGKFMRRTRIDKLPMFWNVLVGDMSVVGPRPHKLALTEQYDKLADKYMLRHFVKPGITGWAQVTGFRGEVYELSQMEGRIERDIWYIQHWSFWLDLRIIWLTFKTIFKRDKNAY